MDQPAEAYLTTAQVAEVCRVPVSTVRAWCRSGRIRATHAGAHGTWRIPTSAVDDLLEEVAIEDQWGDRVGDKRIPASEEAADSPGLYLTTAQVAAMYRVPVRIVRSWCQAGRLAATRVGPRGEWRILRSQFSAGPDDVRTLLATVDRLNSRFGGEAIDDYE